MTYGTAREIGQDGSFLVFIYCHTAFDTEA